jgi:hypothetical protein
MCPKFRFPCGFISLVVVSYFYAHIDPDRQQGLSYSKLVSPTAIA